MSTYSIKDIERFSGIKAHTIRIWEQRYKMLNPIRTDSNIRIYTDADLRHILNVSFLNNQGIKISHIAKLTPGAIHAQVLEITENAITPEIQIDSLIQAMINYDESSFEKTFSLCVQKVGFDKTITTIIYPFLQKLGVMWHTGITTPGQEHFIVNLIRQKLILAAEKIALNATNKSKTFLLYLPENEFHEVALLYYNYWLRFNGYRTVYLGQSVPYEDFVKAFTQISPDYVLTIITCPKEELGTQDYIDTMANQFKETTFFVSGKQEVLSELRIPKNLQLFKNPGHFSTLLKEI